MTNYLSRPARAMFIRGHPRINEPIHCSVNALSWSGSRWIWRTFFFKVRQDYIMDEISVHYRKPYTFTFTPSGRDIINPQAGFW